MFSRLPDWDKTTVLIRPEYWTRTPKGALMCWGIEVVSPTETYVVETYNNWHTWTRNTDVDSVDAGHDFIMAWFEQA